MAEESQEIDLREVVPEEYRDHPALEPIKDIEGLVKSYVNAQSMIGRSIRIPGEDSSDEDRAKFYEKLQQVPGVARIPDEGDEEGWKEFWRTLGAPEKPDDYELPKPEDEEKLAYSQELEKEFRETAAKLNLTKSQAKGLYEWWNGLQERAAEATQEALRASQEALKKEWGQEYDRRLAIAQRAAEELGGEALLEELDRTGLGNSPVLAKLFHDLGMTMLEDEVIQGEAPRLPAAEEIRDKISEIRNNPSHPYYDANHPGHEDAVRRMKSLYEQLAKIGG